MARPAAHRPVGCLGYGRSQRHSSRHPCHVAPPETVPEIFDLMLRSPLLGLVSIDGLYLVNNVMVLLVYRGLAVPLWAASRSAVALALTQRRDLAA